MNILIISHGDYAKGALSALEMIVGLNENIKSLSMKDDIKGFEEQLAHHMEKKDTVVIADLEGGHPFNTASKIAIQSDNNIIVMGNFNLSLLIEVVILAHNNDMNDLKSKLNKIKLETKVISNWE